MKISYLGPEGTYCYGACNLYTQGKDYINPAIRPIFDQLADEAWKEAVRS